MKINLPIYIEEHNKPDALFPVYHARALFYPDYTQSDEKVNRLLQKLNRDIQSSLRNAAYNNKFQYLADFTFSPNLDEQIIKVKLDLGDRHLSGKFLFVIMEYFDRRLVFTPNIPDFWFDLNRGEILSERASEVISRYFRDLEKKEGHGEVDFEAYFIKGKAWITMLDVYVGLDVIPAKKSEENRASIVSTERLNGEAELNKVGRCIDWLFPDDLDRVLYRQREVSELTKFLTSEDRRPVLLLGARQSGKTAIIHEYVYQALEKRGRRSQSRNVWLISPQRLISGMSYVGQWEQRLLAILETAQFRDHILYFDDLLGLYYAGVSSSSSLNVMQVLKPRIEKGEFRILAEITPEAFRVLQEQDRGFADQFHIVRVNETSEDETLRILITVIRQLERQYQCVFNFEVIPTVMNLLQRYMRDSAFPGKAANFLRKVALKYVKRSINRTIVLQEFHAQSGLSLAFIDDNVKLERKDIVEPIADRVIGQTGAIAAAADCISIAKARINDPERPFATFLFLGPTGVGKTECAKAIAAYLFGDAEKIVRFDMNEFLSASSVPRLVGTFDQPEGLLTSAVRRQPFSLILLDEIEKAHPDVFNLLLQVMGDGRLTDALGRTADFTNTIIIMTSNLGVKEASTQLGFRQEESSETAIFIQSAQKFFKPEFYNRIDRIVPFQRLSRIEVKGIAVNLINSVLAREGLNRRRSILQVEDRAMDKIVDQGYHPLMGARALKRAVERQLTRPVAAALVSMTKINPTVINLFLADDEMEVVVQELTLLPDDQLMKGSFNIDDTQLISIYLDEIADKLDDLEDELSQYRPSGAIDPNMLEPEQYLYFFINEKLRRLRNLSYRITERMNKPKRDSVMLARFPGRNKRTQPQTPPSVPVKRVADRDALSTLMLREDLQSALQDLLQQATIDKDSVTLLTEVMQETALIDTIWQHKESDREAHTLIIIQTVNADKTKPNQMKLTSFLMEYYTRIFNHNLGLNSLEIPKPPALANHNYSLLLIKGGHGFKLAQCENGTHLFVLEHGQLVLVKVLAIPVNANEDIFTLVDKYFKEHNQLLPIKRIYGERGIVLDLHSGIITEKLTNSDLRSFILAKGV